MSWKVPQDLPLRPTTSFALEGLINILHHRFGLEGKKVLDLFCGTGQISLELASRGASEVVAVDKMMTTCRIIQKTAMEWNLPVRVIKTDVFDFIRNEQHDTYDLIFADPPYDIYDGKEIIITLFENSWLSPGGWLVFEHSSKADFSNLEQFMEKRKYGNVCFSFFRQDPRHD
ncbi:MAG: RsmD family RNA methyltransferase [Bacteroidia bacterium]|nr:RsmD family RNA methyltransferase [Bacteroidia bacterium]